jgi:hypothetical protein
VVLAADALTGFSRGAAIFRDIPALVDTSAPSDPEACGCEPASALN